MEEDRDGEDDTGRGERNDPPGNSDRQIASLEDERTVLKEELEHSAASLSSPVETAGRNPAPHEIDLGTRQVANELAQGVNKRYEVSVARA